MTDHDPKAPRLRKPVDLVKQVRDLVDDVSEIKTDNRALWRFVVVGGGFCVVSLVLQLHHCGTPHMESVPDAATR